MSSSVVGATVTGTAGNDALSAGAGADLLFVPAPTEIYPPGFQTWVDVEELSRGLEG